jgi:hypothetical protein
MINRKSFALLFIGFFFITSCANKSIVSSDEYTISTDTWRDFSIKVDKNFGSVRIPVA